MAAGTREAQAANLVDWRLRLEGSQQPFADQLRENADPYAVASSLGLPIPEYVRFASPVELLADVEIGLQPLKDHGISNYYVGLRPIEDGLPKYRNEEPLTVEEVVPI
jgi:hypothetical protein